MKLLVVLLVLGLLILPMAMSRAGTPAPVPMYPDLASYIHARTAEFDQIDDEHRTLLDAFAKVITRQVAEGKTVRLTFICTHNSRRSHMAQIWACAAAAHYAIPDVQTYSGGTESTAFNPRAVAAIDRAGLRVDKTTDDANPIYHVRMHEDAPPATHFSKVYDQAPNPREGYIAVMVCANANEACPVVPGADDRFAIAYEDPKAFDGTKLEAAKYDERCAQISREMLYAFSRVVH